MSTRKATNFRWLKWFGWGVLGLVVSVPVLVIAVRVAYQYAWTVVGDSTGISYKATPLVQSIQPLKEAINLVAKSNGMSPVKNNDGVGNYSFYWEKVSGLFSDKKYQLSMGFEAHPVDEFDARKREITLIIYTTDSGKSNEWQEVAKSVETAIAPLVKVNSVSIEVDSSVYGLCSSPENPTKADTYCNFKVPFPVDFKKFNEIVLEPRARSHTK